MSAGSRRAGKRFVRVLGEWTKGDRVMSRDGESTIPRELAKGGRAGVNRIRVRVCSADIYADVYLFPTRAGPEMRVPQPMMDSTLYQILRDQASDSARNLSVS